MKLMQYIDRTNLLTCTEIEKVKLLCYFHLKKNKVLEFHLKDVSNWFNELNLSTPNTSRLKSKILSSRFFIRGSKENTYKLNLMTIKEMDKSYPEMDIKSEEIVSVSNVIPENIYVNTRGYVENLAKQINASYDNNIFDGCAVLMRRLLEILLILTYEHLNISEEIQDKEYNYLILEKIISKAKKNKKINLSRNTKSSIDYFRTLGNFSAHKIYYNCRRSDIEKTIFDYRVIIEELLYKSGIRV